MKLFRPRQYRFSIYDIDYQALKRWGFKALFFDVDNTILPYDETEVSEQARELIDSLKKLGFQVWILSNGKEQRVRHITSQLGIRGVWKAGKPFLFRFRRERRREHLKARECVVIGDQIFTDVWMANMEGAFSVLVKPISLIRDEAITRIKRPLERTLIRKWNLKVRRIIRRTDSSDTSLTPSETESEKNS